MLNKIIGGSVGNMSEISIIVGEIRFTVDGLRSEWMNLVYFG